MLHKKCKRKYFSTGISHLLVKIVDPEEKEILHSFQNQSTYLPDAVVGSYGYLMYSHRWHLPNESTRNFTVIVKAFFNDVLNRCAFCLTSSACAIILTL